MTFRTDLVESTVTYLLSGFTYPFADSPHLTKMPVKMLQLAVKNNTCNIFTTSSVYYGSMTDDKELIRKIISGDTGAFRTLIERYQRLVAHIVFRMIRNASERQDVCQDVFVKVYQNLSSFHHESKMSTWVARIAYNTSVNYLKKKKVPLFDDYASVEPPIENHPTDHRSPEEQTEEHDFSERLRHEIEHLPPRYRTILTLYHLDQMTYAEIGQICGMPDGTVKSYLFRARKILKDSLLAKYKQEELWL